jgi:hypothetical protein
MTAVFTASADALACPGLWYRQPPVDAAGYRLGLLGMASSRAWQ